MNELHRQRLATELHRQGLTAELHRQRLTAELHCQRLATELHKPFRKPKQLRKIKFRSKDNIWNADLIIMPQEDGYKYILTVLDGYTRYAWCVSH